MVPPFCDPTKPPTSSLPYHQHRLPSIMVSPFLHNLHHNRHSRFLDNGSSILISHQAAQNHQEPPTCITCNNYQSATTSRLQYRPHQPSISQLHNLQRMVPPSMLSHQAAQNRSKPPTIIITCMNTIRIPSANRHPRIIIDISTCITCNNGSSILISHQAAYIILITITLWHSRHRRMVPRFLHTNLHC